MKKIIIIITIFFSTISTISAKEIKRIVVGSKDAKITIIAYESLTCSHCANFHKDVYPELKKNYLDTGCLLYTSPSPRDRSLSRMPSSA